MTPYKVLCERMRDHKRFIRTIDAKNVGEALRIATRHLATEPEDYYVVAVEECWDGEGVATNDQHI